MLRGAVFVDHMNFNIAVGDYYNSLGKKTPNLDYNTVFCGVVSLIPGISYTKTTIFAPEPDSFLMQDPYLAKYYKWVQGMRNARYLDVVEGRYIGRPVIDTAPMDIRDKSTYYPHIIRSKKARTSIWLFTHSARHTTMRMTLPLFSVQTQITSVFTDN